ncbi:F-box protein-like [Abeliophyllum distichum]|uniref:F-box protein-like n=1 Tax=Abeliophyllum distichum TaxID=126358 RepID=A0ABD1UPQ8_9LAMI
MDNQDGFKQSYHCIPFSKSKNSELEVGDKILMPVSALQELLNKETQHPWLFQIKKHYNAGQVSHCGVLEFTADEGSIVVPDWMMENLNLQQGELVMVESALLPAGKYMKLQPHSTRFIQLSNPKAVLGKNLSNFSCLSTGDTIMITHNDEKFFINILETKPGPAICLIGTDCEADFSPPLDYKQHEKPEKVEQNAGSQVQKKEIAEQPVFRPFTGKGRSSALGSNSVEKTPKSSSIGDLFQNMSFNGGLFQIFSWLSGKDICKYSSVCKSSNELLMEEFFINKQFRNMQLMDDTGFLIQYWLHGVEFHASSSNSTQECLVPTESMEFLRSTGWRVVASSNGLLCLKNMGDTRNPLFLFNPTTKTLLKIPLADNFEMKDLNNIVFDCNGDEYLLMVLKSPSDWNGDFHSIFYSPKEQIWKDGHNINLGERGIIFENSIYQNDVVYMISEWGHPFGWPYIVAYNIKKGVSKFLKIPITARKGLQQDNKNCKLKIFKNGNSANLFKSIILVKYYKLVFTMWLLIDLEEGTWSQIFKMRTKAMGLTLTNKLHVAGFTIQNGNIVLVATQDKVYRYNCIQDNCEELCNHGCKDSVGYQYLYGDCVRFHSFISTLRPCGPGAKKIVKS